ncbi:MULTISPECIES: cation-transporting P-type ATPase [Streptomyces]|uniref:cation-transporting P-type ATPase n=1 Tax=Streptomyces TaxID=1883 RepID=UPI0036AFBF78
MTVRAESAGGRPPAPGDAWYTRTPQEVAAAFGVDPAVGLSAARAAELLAAHGPNALPAQERTPGWRRFSRSTAATCRSCCWPRRSSHCSSGSGPPRSC